MLHSHINMYVSLCKTYFDGSMLTLEKNKINKRGDGQTDILLHIKHLV